MNSRDREVLLDIHQLEKYFEVKDGFFGKTAWVKAVDGVSFTIRKGETVGLVGESGCGKSTLAKTIIRLHQPTSGDIVFKGQNLAKLSKEQLMPFRTQMQMIFQDPNGALNGKMTVRQIISEPLRAYDYLEKGLWQEYIDALLITVGLHPSHSNMYPHEFSSGQRQRIGIARAIALKPEFVICDEPISALDVSVQAQIANMLKQLQETLGLTYLFIAHDLGMIRYMSSRIGVMYLGKLVEFADAEEVYKRPLHPYAMDLLASVSIADPILARRKKREVVGVDIPSAIHLPPGCRYRSRCKYAKPICADVEPSLMDGGNNHFVACHLYR